MPPFSVPIHYVTVAITLAAGLLGYFMGFGFWNMAGFTMAGTVHFITAVDILVRLSLSEPTNNPRA